MTNQLVFKERRDRFLAELGDRAAIIPAASTVIHHADCEYPFRQDSDFWYLTGFDEPNAVALFLPNRPLGERYVLFVEPKDPSIEVWNGMRWGVEGVLQHFGVDVAHSLEEFHSLLEQYLQGAKSLAFRIGRHHKTEPVVLKAWSALLDKAPRSGFAPQSIAPPCAILHRLRLRKDPWELTRMREAAQISSDAHELARQFTKPGMNEREIQALIEQYFLKLGARGPAYGSIVAGGENACILHYTSNNSPLREGDLLLIDAGCSLVDYYNGDITRTFPVGKKFNGEQRALYEIVLAAQQTAIDAVLVGNDTDKVHLTAVRVLVEGLIEIGLLRGNVDSIIEQGSYRHLYMHRTGHWLGLDVHDVGAYRLGDYEVVLEQGMVLTVEPGLYISDRIPVSENQPIIDDRWKGIGIRIEDDVLVTNTEPEVLSSGALKSVDAMEQ
ncbi:MULTISPECIES: aminopeptidase P N-terminal domain-containing protein [Prochlorococcus]|uniref:aminopeptidase P N-terminal domain-containing protein n=1 Tax=Prochlorococcus TaxID=1218 RepID=UPI000533BA15|nr:MULTISPECIES: aminopeptidase P N-terminal domain-containing protein [Prochlorococcus]KGG13469.1 Xaa-Pro aminopeptidase [Prochlorococcus sp. MIT 0601]